MIIGIILVAIALGIIPGTVLPGRGNRGVLLRIRRPGLPTVTGQFDSKPEYGLAYIRYDLNEALKYKDIPGYYENSFPTGDDSVVIDLRWIIDNFSNNRN